MRIRRLARAGLILLVCLSLFGMWHSRTTASEDPNQNLYSSLGIQRINPPVEAPDFVLKDLEGSLVSLKDFQGKVIFLNFWATWCGFCREEMPAMEKLWQKYMDEDFVILAVDVGEGKETVRSFVEENGYTFPVLLDFSREVASTYGIRGYPTTYLIDPKGMLVGTAIGMRDWAGKDALELIEHLLPKKEAKKERG